MLMRLHNTCFLLVHMQLTFGIKCHILHSSSQGVNFDLKCEVAISKARGSSRFARLYTTCFIEIGYAIWKQSNNKIFNGSAASSQQVVKDIMFHVACACKDEDR